MHIYNLDEFPYVEFGSNPTRKVRIIMSPYTTGPDNLTIVNSVVPVGGISDGHIHDDADEIIYFNIDGKIVIDGNEYLVNKNSIAHVPKGKKHECINTSDTEELNLLCIFIPPFNPDGLYPELIEKTGIYLKKLK